MNVAEKVVYRVYLALVCKKFGRPELYPKLVKWFRLEM